MLRPLFTNLQIFTPKRHFTAATKYCVQRRAQATTTQVFSLTSTSTCYIVVIKRTVTAFMKVVLYFVANDIWTAFKKMLRLLFFFSTHCYF